MTEALFPIADVTPRKPDVSGQPKWLRARLAGRDGHRRNPRRAEWDLCYRCGAVVIEGEDFDHMAIRVRADPTPLDPLGEARAILAGRPLFQCVPSRTAAVTEHAYRLHRIAAHPDHRGVGIYIVPEHWCREPLAPPDLITPDPLPRHPDDPPPF